MTTRNHTLEVQPLALERVNHFVLRKQHLAPETQGGGLVQIVADIGGLHATGATTPYLSLFARLPKFECCDLEKELFLRRTLARIRCVRGTVYVHPRELLPMVYNATSDHFGKAAQKFLESRGVSWEEYQHLSQSILKLLINRELSVSEIKAALDSEKDISAVVNLMCDQGLLVRGQPARGWQDIHFRYARFQDYFPKLKLHLDPAKAITALVERYLGAFGPASEGDVVWWTGLGKTQIRDALEKLGDGLLEVNISGLHGGFLLLRSQLDALSTTPLPSTPVVNVLPVQDPYLMGYKERARYLDPAHCDYVFDRGGNATSTMLINGRVAGVWGLEGKQAPLVKFFWLERPGFAVREQAYEKLRAMGRLVCGRGVELKECASMIPLPERMMGNFLSPLREL